MQLKVLGYYGGYPAKGVGTSGYLLSTDNYNVLIDCGSGILLELEKYLDPLKLNAVILSHYHQDHIADVGVLQYYWQLHATRYQEKTLPIYGNTAESLNFAALTWGNNTKSVAYSTLTPLDLGPFVIEFMQTQHPVPAYAMRIFEKKTKKVLTFTSDTRYFDKLVNLSMNSDLLITDTNFFEDKKGIFWQLTSKQSGQLAQKSKSKRLLLSHLPQVGSLNKLASQAKHWAGKDVDVFLPTIGKTIDI